MKVGFIGVGNMGGPMCRNLIKNSGQEILVHDRDAEAVRRCEEVGGAGVGSIAEAIRRVATQWPTGHRPAVRAKPAAAGVE